MVALSGIPAVYSVYYKEKF